MPENAQKIQQQLRRVRKRIKTCSYRTRFNLPNGGPVKQRKIKKTRAQMHTREKVTFSDHRNSFSSNRKGGEIEDRGKAELYAIKERILASG